MIAPIQISRNAAKIISKPEDFQNHFAEFQSIYIPDFLAPDLLALILQGIASAPFKPNTVDRLGNREIEESRNLGRALSFSLRRPALFEWLSAVTKCGKLVNIDGQLAQAIAGRNHALDWHDDQVETQRRLAITINLTETAYEGGLFELRRTNTHELLQTHRHEQLGGALIFAVKPELEHRISPIISGGPRRVFTGWFYGEE